MLSLSEGEDWRKGCGSGEGQYQIDLIIDLIYMEINWEKRNWTYFMNRSR